MWDASKHGDGPAEGGDDDGPSQVGEGEDVEGSADGKVALQGEGDDGEHVGVGGRLREERTQTAKFFSKSVRVLVPEDRQLIRKACRMDLNRLCPTQLFLVRYLEAFGEYFLMRDITLPRFKMLPCLRFCKMK